MVPQSIDCWQPQMGFGRMTHTPLGGYLLIHCKTNENPYMQVSILQKTYALSAIWHSLFPRGVSRVSGMPSAMANVYKQNE